MGSRKSTSIDPPRVPVRPVFDSVAPFADDLARDIDKADKKGLRLQGQERHDEVVTEILREIPGIPGQLGVTPEELAKLPEHHREAARIKPAAAAARRLAELLTDTEAYHVHEINVVADRVSGALDDRPEHRDRFAKVLAHVRAAAQEGARKRRRSK